MIALLTGRVIDDGIIDTGGVGYAVTSVDALPIGEDVQVRVTTTIRENGVTLWAFTSKDQQRLFEALTNVQGVGPATAMSLLRAAGVNQLVAAVQSGDAKELGKTPGVGPKTAQKIVTLLKVPDGLTAQAPQRVPTETVDKVRKALVALGYPEADVTQALDREVESAGDGVTSASLTQSVLARLNQQEVA